MKILETSISFVKNAHSDYNTNYSIYGKVQEKKLRQFIKIQDILLILKIEKNGEYIIARKWIKTEREKNNINSLKIGSIVEVIGKIDYDFYTKENVMNIINLKQIS